MSTSSLNYTYIYFNTLDYTNNSVLSSYTLSNTPLKFVPDFTTSNILSGVQNISSKTLRWEFGDGTFSTDLSPSHVYQWPGIYNVSLTVYDGSGNAYDSTFTSTVQIFDYIANQISFADYKSLIYDIPAGKLIDPLTVYTHFSWQSYQALSAIGYTINLYASGARGDYDYIAKEQNDKWSHLRSLSRFYALSTLNGYTDYVNIESIQPTITPIYVNIQNNRLQPCQSTDPGSVIAGVTGSCEFWYTDDKPGNLLTEGSPVIIFASVDNSKFKDAFTQRTNAFEYISYPPFGYQNIDPAVFPSIKTRYNPADHLSITTTGIDGEGTPVDHAFDIPYISWQNTEIPYVIKFKDNQDFTTKNYPPLSSSNTQNTAITPQPQYDIQAGIVYSANDGSTTALDGVTFYEDFAPQAPQSIGAFFKGYFISENSTENCYLTASVNVIDPPYYVKDALINWLTIPQYNSAIRILRQENINGFDKTTVINFPNTATYNINANNVYAITVAPSGSTADLDYQTWFADPVGDQLLKYDVYGNLLQTYQLSAMVTLINNQTSIVDYRYPNTANSLSAAAPNDMALDNKNNLWISLIDSGRVIKLENSNGYVTTIASLGSASDTYTLSQDYASLSGYAGENLALPASIDTDRDNNIWVAYTHPDYSVLTKYQGENNFTTSAVILTSITFPSGISPEQIRVDRNNYVWATAINHNSQGVDFNHRNDYLFKFDGSGNLLPGYPLSGFQQIGNLTIDGNQNAWVIQGAETLTKVDGVSGTTANYIAGLGNNKTEYICSIGGLTCDTSNNIWVINNFDYNLYIIDANLPATGVFNPKYIIPLTYPDTTLPTLTSYSPIAKAVNITESNSWTCPLGVTSISALIIAGGGGGGGTNSYGGGGGAGGAILSAISVTPGQVYNITVGAGGAGSVDFGHGTSGSNSVAFGLTAIGGGYGGGYISSGGGGNGGSGGGGGYIAGPTGGSGTLTQGFSGGYVLGGGGGAGGAGTAGNAGIPANGGIGIINPIPGSTIGQLFANQYWLAGGGGGKYNNPGFGGLGGGGDVGANGIANTGGGGGASSNSTGGSGGSGVVIIAYQVFSAATYTPPHGQYSDGLQEFQAIGDWNGYSWLNKYASPVSTIRTITGSSALFNIYPDSGQFNIAKINENWNASGYYDSLRFQETLLDKEVFFDQFLGVILGGLNAHPYELGKTVYEKIANFVDNNSDIDKVNVNELLSFCRELSIEFNQYNVIFPPQLRRIVDLLSIKQSNLWGIQNKYNTNFDPRGTQFTNNTYGTNLGSIIDPLTGVFTNGVPIVAQEIFSGNYKLVNTNIIEPESYYTILSTLALSTYSPNWGWGLVAPDITGTQINNYYKFYNYIPTYNNTYYDNIIDWNDPYTTLLPTNSAYADWSQDNGIMQSLLSYELTKGFKLFTSAAHITYNS